MLDSHLHLDDEKLAQNTDQIVKDMLACGVDLVINNSSDYKSMLAGVALAQKYPQVWATIGVHPHESKSFDEQFAQTMTQLATNEKVVAVGEIGLDYYYDLSDRQTQKDVFAQQIELADKFGLPLTLHIRDAYGDAVDILNAQKRYLNNGVLWHCYSGSDELARQMVKKGHYFAFGGAITFKNANKQSVIDAIPIERVLSETDSPYMAPVPLRGTVNTPCNIPLIVAKLAQMYNVDFTTMENQINANAMKLFTKLKR